MHLHARYTGLAVFLHGTPAPPFGPGFSAEDIAAADTLEVWNTSLQDPADVTVWRLLRAGTVVAHAQLGGW